MTTASNAGDKGGDNTNPTVFFTPDGKQVEIRDVWAETLESEMAHIRDLLVAKPKPYNYIAMVNTTFGIIIGHPA